MDAALKLGRTLFATGRLRPALSTSRGGASAHGAGSCATTSGEGRLRVVSGSFSELANDPNREIVVRFLTRPLEGRRFSLRIFFKFGTVISGVRADQGDSAQSGSLTGSTGCWTAPPRPRRWRKGAGA